MSRAERIVASLCALYVLAEFAIVAVMYRGVA